MDVRRFQCGQIRGKERLAWLKALRKIDLMVDVEQRVIGHQERRGMIRDSLSEYMNVAFSVDVIAPCTHKEPYLGKRRDNRAAVEIGNRFGEGAVDDVQHGPLMTKRFLARNDQTLNKQ